MKTTGAPSKLTLAADRNKITADGKDLSFITVTITDKNGLQVPRSKNHLKFEIEGPGEIIATDNGDATSFESFQAPERNAFNRTCFSHRPREGRPKGNHHLESDLARFEVCQRKAQSFVKTSHLRQHGVG